MSDWQPISTEPPPNIPCIIHIKDGDIYYKMWWDKEERVFQDRGISTTHHIPLVIAREDVTHWMLCPETPEKEKSDE